MSDRELLEMAAKAAQYSYDGTVLRNTKTDFEYDGWNPLDDDGDALRLAVKLKLDVRIEWWGVEVLAPRVEVTAEECSDAYAATRRAIVRAAAEIGRNMK